MFHPRDGAATIVTTCVDHFLALASIVADEMYGKPIPVVAISAEEFATLRSDEQVQIFLDGALLAPLLETTWLNSAISL